MQVVLFVAFMLCLSFSRSLGDTAASNGEGSDTTSTKSLEDFQRMSVKALRGILKAKGLECKGCSEKAEYVQKVFDSQDLPDVGPSVAEVKMQPDGKYSAPPGVDQDKMDELMAKLRSGGFGNSRMFSADDLKNMSPEEMSEKLGGGFPGRSKKGKGKGGKKSKKASKRDSVGVEDGGETIEL